MLKSLVIGSTKVIIAIPSFKIKSFKLVWYGMTILRRINGYSKVTHHYGTYFNPVSPSYEGDFSNSSPIISEDLIIGSWSPALNNMLTTVYLFELDFGRCASDNVSLKIQVIAISQLFIDIDLSSEAFSENQVAVINVSGGTGAYEFQLNNGDWREENTFSNLQGCEDYEIRARETSGCSNIAVVNFRVLDYPKFFTPNGDFRNDSWNIECLKDQAEARISIYDRYGKCWLL
jgi:hypothetical protein